MVLLEKFFYITSRITVHTLYARRREPHGNNAIGNICTIMIKSILSAILAKLCILLGIGLLPNFTISQLVHHKDRPRTRPLYYSAFRIFQYNSDKIIQDRSRSNPSFLNRRFFLLTAWRRASFHRLQRLCLRYHCSVLGTKCTLKLNYDISIF